MIECFTFGPGYQPMRCEGRTAGIRAVAPVARHRVHLEVTEGQHTQVINMSSTDAKQLAAQLYNAAQQAREAQ